MVTPWRIELDEPWLLGHSNLLLEAFGRERYRFPKSVWNSRGLGWEDWLFWSFGRIGLHGSTWGLCFFFLDFLTCRWSRYLHRARSGRRNSCGASCFVVSRLWALIFLRGLVSCCWQFWASHWTGSWSNRLKRRFHELAQRLHVFGPL